MRKTKADLEKDLSEARETIRLQNGRINDLMRQVQGRAEDTDYYKTQISTFEIEIEALREKLADAEARLQAATTEKSNRELSLEGEVMQLRSEVAEVRLDAAKDLEKVKRDLERIRKDRDEGNAIIADKERKIIDLRHERNQARATVEAMRATLASLGVEEVVGAMVADYDKPRSGRPKVTQDPVMVARIRSLHDAGMSVRAIGAREGISKSQVSNLLRREVD